MAREVEVFSPAKEKLQLGCWRMGTVNLKRSGSPPRAKASRAAPPFGLRSSPNRRATLSNASPACIHGPHEGTSGYSLVYSVMHHLHAYMGRMREPQGVFQYTLSCIDLH